MMTPPCQIHHDDKMGMKRWMPPQAVRGLFYSTGLSLMGSALPAALFYFYVKDVLQAEPFLIHFLALYVAVGFMSLPLWQRAAQRYGAAASWLWAMVYTIVVFIGVCFLSAGDVIPYAIICALSGITFGAEYMLPVMVLKNAIAAHGDEKQAFSRYAGMAVLAKATGLLGCLPALLFTGMVELPPNAAPTLLVLLYGVVPCALKALAALFLWRWMKNNGEKNENALARGDIHAA